MAVAEAGSLRGAARTLDLAQPAISRSIQELEHALGAQLFVRGGRGGSSPLWGRLHRVLRPFTDRFPRVRLHVIEGFLPTLENDLLKSTVDFYIGPVAEAHAPTDLAITKLIDNERLVIGRNGHPLAGC